MKWDKGLALQALVANAIFLLVVVVVAADELMSEKGGATDG